MIRDGWQTIFGNPPAGYEVTDWEFHETACCGEGWIHAFNKETKTWVSGSAACGNDNQTDWSLPTTEKPE